jgi:hypothetical protein
VVLVHVSSTSVVRVELQRARLVYSMATGHSLLALNFLKLATARGLVT